ncbi:MAG: hypothetical protein QN155_04700 [Armatimonadota bacterium]|nr:hypothetical protein [Armatimonadota bacterium]MDR7404581.1 hypothetical protein [Armatimonadota bacterium]
MRRLRDGRPPGCDHLPGDLFAEDGFRDPATVVECIHCGRRFALGDAVWVPLPGDPVVAGLWSCAHFPDCDGTLIDFVPVRQRPRGQGRPGAVPPAGPRRGRRRTSSDRDRCH